jgi:hypothetical protein
MAGLRTEAAGKHLYSYSAVVMFFVFNDLSPKLQFRDAGDCSHRFIFAPNPFFLFQTLRVQDEDLDNQEGVIDLSLYLR